MDFTGQLHRTDHLQDSVPVDFSLRRFIRLKGERAPGPALANAADGSIFLPEKPEPPFTM